jgi:uncharacterized protein
MTDTMSRFRVFNTIAFVIFSLAIGQVTSALLVSKICNVNAFQILEALKDPINADRNLIVILSAFYSLFSFFIIPVSYLLLYKKDSVKFLLTKNKIRFVPLLLAAMAMFTILPFVAVLIKLNHSIELPSWLASVEAYFKESEEHALLLTNSLLSFGGLKDLIVAILIMAIIPGIVEEVFFRGIVQMQLQDILRNSHYAILGSAFLFSFFHFQFYGFMPRFMFGVLFGYIFIWSGNIWYSCAAHVVNNLIAVLGGYFFGPQILDAENMDVILTVLLFPSVAATALIILKLRRTQDTRMLKATN